MNVLYPSEDAQQILQIAIAKETEAGELSRDQLLEIAGELGITQATLVAAEQEWQQRKGELSDQRTFDGYRQQKFQHHLIRYTVVNVFLVALNLLMGGSLSWSLYIALAWGLGLSLHAWQTFWPSNFRYEADFQKWRRRRHLHQSFNNLLDRFLKA
ncbi:MAG: 2TM domain-containing protein [Leptolyngbyaceae cyanobacterium SM1_1_3]|nr:2TM domain-containing protein [Leptolyngbyaceae cyanobacterium SM1_1_3]NJN01349.1 2TM domain-containing protein [Leptolyngbyaceae cyanobacterium RM1_1_2]NJO10701.1 2TM domain-containing protein [Leptolyngbyaceae cyanobacterium SL_1_1]